jgi:DNA polymerase III subunit epsilon
MREVIFDTETTGLSPAEGDRIVEVGCVELVNLLPTGREFQAYINPGRLMSEGAERVTGITNDMLVGRPPFGAPDVVDRLLEFFGDSPIVAHNAEFDRGFLNAELALLGRAEFAKERFIDTIPLAREHRPGSPASLDAVCKRFNISLEGRDLHGALKDARLLAAAYLELRGGRERRFEFAASARGASARAARRPLPARPQPLEAQVDASEAAAHAVFIETLGAEAIWKRYS